MPRPTRAGLIGAGGLFLLSGVSVFVGVIDLGPGELLRDPEALRLMSVSRLPRTLAALIAGAVLAVAGTIMQAIVRNRFVEPMTTGTGQGAALGILLASFLIPGAPLILRMGFAAATALLATMGFLALVRRLPTTQPMLVPLVGLVYGGLLGAGVTLIGYQFDMLQYVEIWMTGEFSGVLQGRYELLWLAALAAAGIYVIADQMAIVGMGRTVSVGLGLNYRQIMALGLLSLSLVTALTVVTVGVIPFVGLVVPNIVARRYGDNLRRTLPLVALLGAGLVLLSDILGRLVRFPFEVPVGTIFGIIGAVFFLVLLYTQRRHAY
ncbi:MAG: iron chelate uptake ABC transporter family permease subunit [Pseudomonadota bacterium]